MADGKLLQWNQRGLRNRLTSSLRVSLVDITSQIVAQHQPWFVIIQELVSGVDAALRSRGYQVHVDSNRRLCTAWRDPWVRNGLALLEHPHCLLLTFEHATANAKLALWNVHLQSRLHAQDEAIEKQLLEIFSYHVIERRRDPGYQQYLEIIAGDFNLQPYSRAFWNMDANRCLSWALRRSQGPSSKRHLYNPSWELLNARTPTGGTYYYSSAHDSPWFVYDQALMSPQLASLAPVETITAVGTQSLCAGVDSYPNTRVASDHLPVIVPCRV